MKTLFRVGLFVVSILTILLLAYKCGYILGGEKAVGGYATVLIEENLYILHQLDSVDIIEAPVRTNKPLAIVRMVLEKEILAGVYFADLSRSRLAFACGASDHDELAWSAITNAANYFDSHRYERGSKCFPPGIADGMHIIDSYLLNSKKGAQDTGRGVLR